MQFRPWKKPSRVHDDMPPVGSKTTSVPSRPAASLTADFHPFGSFFSVADSPLGKARTSRLSFETSMPMVCWYIFSTLCLSYGPNALVSVQVYGKERGDLTSGRSYSIKGQVDPLPFAIAASRAAVATFYSLKQLLSHKTRAGHLSARIKGDRLDHTFGYALRQSPSP